MPAKQSTISTDTYIRRDRDHDRDHRVTRANIRPAPADEFGVPSWAKPVILTAGFAILGWLLLYTMQNETRIALGEQRDVMLKEELDGIRAELKQNNNTNTAILGELRRMNASNP